MITYTAHHIHYSPQFRVWATSNKVKWDKQNQILFWFPDKNQETNMIVIGIKKDLDIDRLSDKAKKILELYL